MTHTERYDSLREIVNARLESFVIGRPPASLYEPVDHVMRGGGKRVRAILVMIACEAVGGRAEEALDAGLAVELLHNFTLVHDDIMDNADTRRGHQTVHTKWDVGTAILAGDVMIGLAQRLLLATESPRKTEIFNAFSQALIDVCEGQAYDRDFETTQDVSPIEYIRMIGLKTARMLEMAVEVGAYVGNGDEGSVEALRAYARNIGLGFQIQDDLLDLVGDEAEFGKKIGGDIIEGKRTYLVVRANELVTDAEDRRLLERLLNTPGLPESEVPAVRELFERCGVLEEARSEVERYCRVGMESLERLPESDARSALRWLAESLMDRGS